MREIHEKQILYNKYTLKRLNVKKIMKDIYLEININFSTNWFANFLKVNILCGCEVMYMVQCLKK